MAPRFELSTAADVRFGAGRVEEVPAALAQLGIRRVFVVTGRSQARAERVREAMASSGLRSVTFPVPGEPSVELVRTATASLLEADCDGVLGLGGGSALDLAKAVAIMATNGADPMDHLEMIGAGRPLSRPGLPWVAVPTTAGTGSEVTRNAVLSGRGVKASLRSPLMLARVAIVDPDLLVGQQRPTVAAGGLDALTQLIEPYLSRRANPFTDALAREGITRSVRSLRRAWTDGLDDPDLRADLAVASLFGGLCLAGAGLGAVHGFAGPAGGMLDAPHGAVCAALLPAAMEVTLLALARRAPEHPSRARADEVATLLTGDPHADARDGIAYLRELCAALDVRGLGHYGLTEADVPTLVEAAAAASSMKANPIELTRAEQTEIALRSL
jgi:alcohol dehydrogenase class IV